MTTTKLCICAAVCLIAFFSHPGLSQVGAQLTETPTTNNTTTTRQAPRARILLETNNLDLADATSEFASLKNQTSPNELTKKPKRKRKDREDRRLSNIWSIFLPSSSDSTQSDTEYEDSTDTTEDGNSTLAAPAVQPVVAPAKLAQDRNLTDVVNSSGLVSKDGHNERIVAKYSRPPRQDSASSTGESLLVSGSTAGVPARALPANLSDPTRLDQNEPVQFITGSLSKDSSLNFDMMTNPMMNSAGQSEVEREGATGRPANSTSSTESSNFDRWLSRIQAKDQLQTSTLAPSRLIPSKPAQSEFPARVKLGSGQTTTSPHPSIPPINQQDMMKMVALLTDLKLKQQQQSTKQANRMKSFNNIRKSPDLEQQRLNIPLSSRFASTKSQHPFQQQLKRTQNSQLVNGIKSPSAQASSISVSTQDGSSNTSLSFALMNQLQAGSSTEVNPLENSTTSTPMSSSGIQGGSKEEGGQVEQNIYQSQDEILRQVTSAINFEQQLARDPMNQEQSHNHRKAGEIVNQPVMNVEDTSVENMSKLFKSGSSMSELLGDQQMTTKPQTNSTNLLGSADVDKNLETLADKLRQLAQQQSLANQNGSSQPSWLLRKPLMSDTNVLGSAMNLTKLAAISANESVTPANTDKLNELLNKLEKSKTELKNSQETMAILMQQLVQQQQGSKPALNNQLSDSNPPQLIQSESPSSQEDQANQQTSDTSGPGWTPSNKPSFAPISPGNLLKSRVKQTPLKISQQIDNVGVGRDSVSNDDYFMNQLAMMFASTSAADQASHDQNPGQVSIDPHVSQRIVGLPIAIMKEDELELNQGQIDTSAIEEAAAAAADQLNNPPKGAPVRQFTTRLAPTNMNHIPVRQTEREQPMFVQGNRSGQLDQIQKLLQGYSPQTFAPAYHTVNPRAQFMDSSQVPANQQRGLQQLAAVNNDQTASLLPPTSDKTDSGPFKGNMMSSLVKDMERQEGGSGAPSRDNLASTGEVAALDHNPSNALHKDMNSEHKNQVHPSNINIPLAYQPGADLQGFQLQKQAQQQAQPHLAMAPHMRPPGNAYVQTTSTIEYPMRPGLVQEMPPLLPAQPMANFETPMITTTSITSGGPPMRIREISLPRPFGFRGNHAIAYQPSPVVAAMFPRLVGSSQNRPSIFRHMTPIRAGISESQRLIRPLLGSRDGSRSPVFNHRFYTDSALSHLPIHMQNTYIQRFNGGFNERRAQPSRLKRLLLNSPQPNESWHLDKVLSHQPAQYSSPKIIRAIQNEQEQLDTIEFPISEADLLNADDDDNDNNMSFTEDIKYLPMDSSRETTISELNDVKYQALTRSTKDSPLRSLDSHGRPSASNKHLRPHQGQGKHQHRNVVASQKVPKIVTTKTGLHCDQPSLTVDKPSSWLSSGPANRYPHFVQSTTSLPISSSLSTVTSTEPVEQKASSMSPSMTNKEPK